MAKYESLPITTIPADDAALPAHTLPELVHMEDPALSIMIDFEHTPAHIISPNQTMDDALNEMKVTHAHLLLVTDDQDHLQGILSSQDVLGEKPIKILQERRIPRDKLLVKFLMVPVQSIIAIDFNTLNEARVGHIVKTLNDHKQHYALVMAQHENGKPFIRGMFTTAQISKQLHMNFDEAIGQAGSLSELQKRHK